MLVSKFGGCMKKIVVFVMILMCVFSSLVAEKLTPVQKDNARGFIELYSSVLTEKQKNTLLDMIEKDASMDKIEETLYSYLPKKNDDPRVSNSFSEKKALPSLEIRGDSFSKSSVPIKQELAITFVYDPETFKNELTKLFNRQDAVDKSFEKCLATTKTNAASVMRKYIPAYVDKNYYLVKDLKNTFNFFSLTFGEKTCKVRSLYSGNYGPFGLITTAILSDKNSLANAAAWKKYGINELSNVGLENWFASVSAEIQKVYSEINTIISEARKVQMDALAAFNTPITKEDEALIVQFMQENTVAVENIMLAYNDYFSNVDYCLCYVASFFQSYFTCRDGKNMNTLNPMTLYVPAKLNLE